MFQVPMSVRDSITRKLTEALGPSEIEVLDESQRHVGHAGYREGGESHFSVTVVSSHFEGKSRVERHRMVNQLLAEEIAAGLHALSLKTLTPAERQAQG
jgi:BolA protein